MPPLPFLAFDRETLMIAAFAVLAGAGVVVFAGAWILLRRERRTQRSETEESGL